MDRDNDLDDLAERFIRLWEESWRQLAQDPETARHWTGLFGALAPLGTPPPGSATTEPTVADPAPAGPADEPGDRDSAKPAEDGPAPAAAASVDGGEPLDRLEERVRKLEERVARLARRVERGPRR